MKFFQDELFPWWVLNRLNSPVAPQSRYGILREILHAKEPKPDPCPGDGVCHGSLCWCDWCGDVKETCDVEWPHWCDTHKRYPVKPEPPEPDPNQLSFPW